MGNEKERKSKALVKAMMSLYKGAKTKAKVGMHLSEEFDVCIWVHQGSVFLGIFFFTNKIMEGMLQEIMYANELDLIEKM